MESRMIGLGQAPSDSVVNQVFSTTFTQVPVAEYVTWTVELPQTDANLSATFGDEIDILQSPRAVPGVSSVDSSFQLNGILQTDMLAIGFGCHIFAEPQSFVQIGNCQTPIPGAAATVVSPDVFTLNDISELGLPPGGALLPAILKWGHADWEAAWHLANAYQFRWTMAQRHAVVQELVADVSYFGPYADGIAAGTSDVDIQEYARQVNNRYRQIGGGIFVPINARRVGSVNVNPLAATNKGVFHPTRDFDLVSVTHGGIRNQGATGCCSPFRKLCKPVLVEKGIPVGMKLQVQNDYHHQQMTRYMSISEAQGGNLAVVASDSLDTGTSVLSATSGIFELTLDPGAANSFQLQQVNTNRVIMKGGVLKMAILIKGFEVWGKWKDYMLSNTNLATMISSPTAAVMSAGIGGVPTYRG
jgi:hypothetical protein